MRTISVRIAGHQRTAPRPTGRPAVRRAPALRTSTASTEAGRPRGVDDEHSRSTLVTEDSVLLREGLARLLTDAGFDVVARCGDADQLRAELRVALPEVMIVDIRLPPTHTDEGLRAAIELRERHPDLAVLVLSQYVEVGLAMKLLAESADRVGYLRTLRAVEKYVSSIFGKLSLPASRSEPPRPGGAAVPGQLVS